MHGRAILAKVMKAEYNVCKVVLETSSGLFSFLNYLITDVFDEADYDLAFEEERLLTSFTSFLSSCCY